RQRTAGETRAPSGIVQLLLVLQRIAHQTVEVGVPVKVLAGLKLGWEQLDDPPAVDALQLERARDEALLARADVHGAVVAYGTAEEGLRLEVARQYPDVHLGPAYTWDHGIRRYQFNLG